MQTAKENAIAEHGPLTKDSVQTQWNAFSERHFCVAKKPESNFCTSLFCT